MVKLLLPSILLSAPIMGYSMVGAPIVLYHLFSFLEHWLYYIIYFICVSKPCTQDFEFTFFRSSLVGGAHSVSHVVVLCNFHWWLHIFSGVASDGSSKGLYLVCFRFLYLLLCCIYLRKIFCSIEIFLRLFFSVVGMCNDVAAQCSIIKRLIMAVLLS